MIFPDAPPIYLLFLSLIYPYIVEGVSLCQSQNFQDRPKEPFQICAGRMPAYMLVSLIPSHNRVFSIVH